MSLLELEGLSVEYGSIRALRGVSLAVDEGQLVGVLGPNGAGKSSLLHAITGVVRVADGRIRLDGRSIAGASCERIVRCGVALVPEGRNVFASLTVEENLRIGATTRRDRAAVRADLAAACERFPVLGRKRHHAAGSLSGGEQQQLAIGRALLARPRLLLLDEPSLGLAPVIIDEVFAVLGELREQGVTMLLVEQHATRTAAFADHCYVLQHGEVSLHRTRADFASDPELASLYLG